MNTEKIAFIGASFSVGLSFAGEQRDYVESVALALQARNVDVFYDGFHEVELWGCNLVDTLNDLYSERMKAVIIFVSKDYIEKPFTDVERQAALSAAIRTREKYIFPVRFDEVKMPGLPSTIGYLEASRNTPEQLATKICQVIGAASSLKDDNITPPRSQSALGSLSFSQVDNNGKAMMVKKSGTEDPISISGIESDPKIAGLWNADWPATVHVYSDMYEKIVPVQGSRTWLRVIPSDFPNGIPPVSDVHELNGTNAGLCPPVGHNGWNPGPCEFGYLAASESGKIEDGVIESHNMAAFLDETGEIWSSSADFSSRNKEGIEIIYRTPLLLNWQWGLKKAMKCLDALDASKHRRIVIGIEGLKDLSWYHGEQFIDSPARKSKMDHDVTKHEWSVQDQKDFLTNAWNKLLDAFSLSPRDGASNLEHCLSNFDKQ